ncbi:hypothetical protein ACSBR1_021052 [Camellia fascicularis]
MNQSCESECKKIHGSLGRINHLAQALACKTQLEIKKIRETYLAMYGEDLIDLLQKNSQLSNTQKNVCEALYMWMLDPIEREAVMAREALDQQRSEVNYKVLVEMFVGRKSSLVVLIKQAYQAKFRRQMDQDIVNIEPPHPYKKILVALVASHKAHHADVSQHIAKCDAKRLHQTGEGRSGSIDEAVVLEIFSKRSIPQLKLTFSCYKHIYGHDYTKSLKNGNYGEFEDALKVVVKCMYNPPKYYAKILYASMKGITTDKGGLTRVMMNRGEVEMEETERVFKKKYGMELNEAICESESIPSGDYRHFLVALATRTRTTHTTITATALSS